MAAPGEPHLPVPQSLTPAATKVAQVALKWRSSGAPGIASTIRDGIHNEPATMATQSEVKKASRPKSLPNSPSECLDTDEQQCQCHRQHIRRWRDILRHRGCWYGSLAIAFERSPGTDDRSQSELGAAGATCAELPRRRSECRLVSAPSLVNPQSLRSWPPRTQPKVSVQRTRDGSAPGRPGGGS